MNGLIAVASVADIPAGTVRGFTIEGRRIAVFHTSSGFFATDGICPNRGGPLSEGDLVRDSVTCPWHAWTFDLRTGQSDVDPDKIVATHEVLVRDGTVMIRLSAAKDEGR